MYNFIFYFIYVKNLENDGKKVARILGAMMVFSAFFGQVFCSFVLFQFFYKIITLHDLLKQSFRYQQRINIIPIFFFCGLCILLTFLYFNKERVIKIEEQFNNKSGLEFSTRQNVIKFVIVYLMPWVIAVVLG